MKSTTAIAIHKVISFQLSSKDIKVENMWKSNFMHENITRCEMHDFRDLPRSSFVLLSISDLKFGM